MQKAKEILNEHPYCVELARERASCGCWPAPNSPSDFLMWIEDEADTQADQGEQYPDENRKPYAAYLREVADLLRDTGVVPSTPPWELVDVN